MLPGLVTSLAIICAATALAAPHTVRNNNGSPTVTIKDGTVRGRDNAAYGQQEFLGIPYAQQPIGDLRLRPAKALANGFGELDATSYGPACWSRFGPAFDDNSGYESSESCLFLNVVRPYGIYNGEGGKTAPVVVWIHGGGLTTGSAADRRYNASAYVDASVQNGSPMVFVSINYRLASFGFLGGQALADEGSLNLGIRDQRLALKWVQDNIAAFGGDPSRVTIQGESAGGRSVFAHVVANGGNTDGLFHKAVVQSGSGLGAFALPGSGAFQQNFDSLLGNSSCASTRSSSGAEQLACVRQLPVEEFRRFSNGSTGILRDNTLFNVPNTIAAVESGNYARVPFLITTNTDEGVSFGVKGANTTEQARARITQVPEANRDDMLELYPNVPALGAPFNTGDYQLYPVQNNVFLTPGLQNKRVDAITGDVGQQAGPRYFAEKFSNDGLNVYRGRFNRVPWTVSWGVQDYVGHFTEVSYAFNLQNNDTAFWEQYHFTATYLGPGAPIQDRALGDYMSRSWAAFVTEGDPNKANFTGKPYWPKYSESQSNLVFQTQGSIVEKDNYRSEGIRYIIDRVFKAAA